jgi:serine/threonine protein kinase
MPDLSGQTIGRYHIIEKLGEGGMAIVYKAYDTHLECEVAVKVIRTDNILPSTLNRALQRFEREAKSVAKLNHQNIVSVTDYGNYEGKPYLVMPYLTGGTLQQLLVKKQRMNWREALELVLPITEALAYAHSRNIIHRDVKPSNVLLTHSGQPMLTDFGVAKIVDNEDTMDLTGTMATVGTPQYMAPEQVSSKTFDARVDVYSLGIVLYEMVTGRRPFEAETPMAVMIMHSRDPLPRPTAINPDLPIEVEYLLIKALAKDPHDRFSTMNEFHQAIEKLLGKETTNLAGASAQSNLPSVDTLRTTDDQPSAVTFQQPPVIPPNVPPLFPVYPQPTAKLGHRGLPIILAGLGLTVIAIIIVIVINGSKNSNGLADTTGDSNNANGVVVQATSAHSSAGSTPIPTRTPQIQPMITPALHSVSGCNTSSHIKIGDLVYVTQGEGYNGIRTTPDDTLSNVFARAYGGDVLLVTDGPVCDRVDYLHWYVEPMFSSDWEEGGWTPEVAKSEGEYWLAPFPYWEPCGNSPISHLQIGDRAYVTTRGDTANRVRSDAGLDTETVGVIDPGEMMTIIDGPICADKIIWWEVTGDNGVTGWTAEGKGNDFWLIPVLNQYN